MRFLSLAHPIKMTNLIAKGLYPVLIKVKPSNEECVCLGLNKLENEYNEF